MNVAILFLLTLAGCSLSGKVGSLECTSSCDDDEQTCFDVCETECVDAGGNIDEACDTDCHTECTSVWDSCTVSCDDNG